MAKNINLKCFTKMFLRNMCALQSKKKVINNLLTHRRFFKSKIYLKKESKRNNRKEI